MVRRALAVRHCPRLASSHQRTGGGASGLDRRAVKEDPRGVEAPVSQQVGDQEGLAETLERIAPGGARYERKFARRGAAGLVAGTRAADRAIPESPAPAQVRRRDAIYR